MYKREKPQIIEVTVLAEFQKLYMSQIGKAIRRKFYIDCGIEGDFTDEGGMSELNIRFLANDDKAQDIETYMASKWEFITQPRLLP